MIPTHVAIIADGNGRYAKEKNFNRSFGHKVGSENAKKLALHAFKIGVKYLSLYIFSCDNFKRSKEEVGFLFDLFIRTFKNEEKIYMRENIKVIVSGVNDNLPPKLIEVLNELTSTTKDNTGGVLNLCLNYSSKQELAIAIKRIYEDINAKKISLDDINEDTINKYMFHELPPIDFLIRTSGEMRLSDFMLYQNAYAELYFSKIYFPAFDEKEFDKAILEYENRNRRFGGIEYENTSN